jgi:hypothetical protein
MEESTPPLDEKRRIWMGQDRPQRWRGSGFWEQEKEWECCQQGIMMGQFSVRAVRFQKSAVSNRVSVNLLET